ncbi:hypothetical protein Goari_003639, partial [Gossypium aridum]|nr:hypothetical protein [Gossypium aridum]
FTVAAADYPGCKPNCIYSTDASIDVADIGIYDVEKNRDKDIGLEPFPKSKPGEQLLSFAPPVWIIPYPPLILNEIFDVLNFSEIRGWKYWGSPFGWLVACGLDLRNSIFKLDIHTRYWERIFCWVMVTVATDDYPGCKPNCIYFLDDNFSC